MGKEKIEPICMKFSMSATEYLRNELPLSEMTIYANHIDSCKLCQTTLRSEKKLDNYVLGAEQKNIYENEPDAAVMEQLHKTIMSRIKDTNQHESAQDIGDGKIYKNPDLTHR